MLFGFVAIRTLSQTMGMYGKYILPFSIAALLSLVLTMFLMQYNANYSFRKSYSIKRKENLDSGAVSLQQQNEEVADGGESSFVSLRHQMGEVNPPLKTFMGKIVYNRVGKCGSRSMLTLIARLAKENQFLFYSSPISNTTRPSFVNLMNEVELINNLPTISFYSRHIHFIDFMKYGVVPPVYINMIRDPIDRFVSQYYFQRYGDQIKSVGRHSKPWRSGEKSMDINDCILSNHSACSMSKLFYIVPYFCGQDPICQRPSEESLARAKVHLMENYLIVGYLEDFEGMLKVLELSLPRFFHGSLQHWAEISVVTQNRTSTLHKRALNSTTYNVLREKMAMEYEFYNFVRARFRSIKRQLGI